MEKSLGLIEEITIHSKQKDETSAASYREALRAAKEFWHLYNLLSDGLPQKQELLNQYIEAMED